MLSNEQMSNFENGTVTLTVTLRTGVPQTHHDMISTSYHPPSVQVLPSLGYNLITIAW